MGKRPLITQPNTGSLWVVDPHTPAITIFDPAPPGAVAGRAIYCDDTGRIICPYGSGFYHYDPSTHLWATLSGPTGIWDMDGTDYGNVWAVAGDAHTVGQFNGTVWTVDATLTSARMHQVAVGGPGLDEVFVSGSDHVWFRTGGAIGSGVWVDRRAQLLTDTGLDISGAVPDVRGVWAVNKTQVYWLISGTENNLTQHWIVLWDGANFSIVSTSTVNNYSVSDTSLDGVSGDNLWWMQASGSYGQYRFVKFDGANIIRQTVEHNLQFGCKLIAEPPEKWWAAGAYSGPNRIGVWLGDGSQNGWSLLHTQTVGTSVIGNAGLAAWTSRPPELRNQDPAPSSINKRGDGPIYLEVFDRDGDLVPGSVEIWVDGILAWVGTGSVGSWSGTRAAVSQGYSYTITPFNPLPAGSPTSVRVRAEDLDGNLMDVEYGYETGVFLDSLDRSEVSERGGEVIVATGLWQVGTPVEATLAEVGCFGGSGKGYAPSSEDGLTLEVVAPPLEVVSTQRLQVFTPHHGVKQALIDVVERSWKGLEFVSRRMHPPRRAVGARRLDLEGLVSFVIEEQEEPDMPSPKVIYNAGTVDVELPDGSMGQAVNYRLQDGQLYPLESGDNCDLDAAGVNGLDTGSRAINTWYHLYLVPDAGVLKPIFSAAGPATGPDGYSNFLPILAVFNTAADEIAPFDVEGAWVHFRRINDRVRIINTSSALTAGSWEAIDLSDMTGVVGTLFPTGFPGFPMDVIDAAEFGGFLDRDSGGLAFWIRGGTTTPTEAPTGNWSTGGAEFLQSNTAEGRCKRVALPGVNIYWRGTQASGNELALRVVAFRHKYRW